MDLPALAVGGMVHISKLADDFVRFDEFHETLAGGGRTWTVGDKLKVRVEKVDFDRRQIDFAPVAERPARRNSSRGRARRQANQFQQGQSQPRRKRK